MAELNEAAESRQACVREHPASGDRVVFLIGAEDSDGKLFQFEYVTRRASPAPPDHVHHEQEERVSVLEGHVSCRVDGRERVLGPGESIAIPPGVSHAVWSADPAGSRSIGEFRPALRMQQSFEAAFRPVSPGSD